jgi:3-oxoacyl-[acyl-carrier protein] reductase
MTSAAARPKTPALFSLTGRTALVTGAGQGIGACIAEVLAGLGAAVAVNDLYEERAAEVARRLTGEGARAVAVAGDVTEQAAVAALVERVRGELGSVDILVNNAGIPASGMKLTRFADSSPVDWRPMVDLNLYGVMLTSHTVLPDMLAREHGRIITIVSDAGRVGERDQVAYAAAKAGAAGFSRALAKEVGRKGITCNCLALGAIENPRGGRDPDLLARQLALYPVGRLGTPMDVAAAVAWLASDEASWVTGQTIPVNGGYSTS